MILIQKGRIFMSKIRVGGTNRVILYFSNQDKKLDGGSAVRVSDSPQLLEELGLILEEENVVMR